MKKLYTVEEVLEFTKFRLRNVGCENGENYIISRSDLVPVPDWKQIFVGMNSVLEYRNENYNIYNKKH